MNGERKKEVINWSYDSVGYAQNVLLNVNYAHLYRLLKRLPSKHTSSYKFVIFCLV